MTTVTRLAAMQIIMISAQGSATEMSLALGGVYES